MAPKRPLDSENAPESSKAAKKAKTKAARVIDVQQTSQSSRGPSRPRPSVRFTADSLKGLPNSIDVEKFVEARSFEVGAMQKAMQTAREDASKRVWQTLPRHMRRRTASHDSTRVPVRLREKARAEMDPVKKRRKLNALPKRGKTDIGRTAKLLKRQQDKTWLETHIWHAKRMKMENLWGHRLAIHPTEKAFRPSHRAALHGSIVQDISYYGMLEVKGPENLLKDILSRCCDPQSPIFLNCYTSGARACDTHIYEVARYPFGLICPCTLIWMPNDAAGRDIETTDSAATRVVWLHVHPSVFLEVHRTVRTAASDVSDTSHQVSQIEITDLRDSINAYEIVGPRASQVLTGALKATKESGSGRKAWNSLASLSSSASVPKGMVIGLQVFDPRLSFPPSNAQLPEADRQSSGTAFSVPPSAEMALSEIWQEKVREKLRNPKFTKKDLDERRSKNLVPGTRLQPQPSDARIPILLIQRSISPVCGSSSSSGASDSQMHGYLLFFPAGWSMPFWSSITHTGTRVGGLREHKSQRFESGTPHFPEDYVGTRSYELHWENRAIEESAKWDRTPKAKRPPYDLMPAPSKIQGHEVLWKPDWAGILGLVAKQGNRILGNEPDLVPTQRPDDMDRILDSIIQEGNSELEEDDDVAWEGIGGVSTSGGPDHHDRDAPWVLHGTHATTLLSTLASSSSSAHPEVLRHINKLRAKRGLEPLPEDVAENLTKSALVPVKIDMCGRGAPEDISVVYDASGDLGTLEEAAWSKTMAQMIENDSRRDAVETETIATPDPTKIIGYTTSGSFSLAKGKGAALGAVSLVGLLEIMRRDVK
ncbi:hypothetical protein FS837_005712 [Tulasnella sp. UAMH 9824]|nr:hypothetical protein FS837_005712 [Tulasnella sp. UAMH 9824]